MHGGNLRHNVNVGKNALLLITHAAVAGVVQEGRTDFALYFDTSRTHTRTPNTHISKLYVHQRCSHFVLIE
jgi:hypothetical protein